MKILGLRELIVSILGPKPLTAPPKFTARYQLPKPKPAFVAKKRCRKMIQASQRRNRR